MPDITYGSVCSGIEAATQGWHPLGMRAAWFAEIEPFPSAVLAHHYPDVPNYGDMTKLAALVLAGKIPAPDVLVGGTPCQAFSVAGMREGLTDPRGALTIKYVELADAVDYVRAGQRKPASVIVWENVPGVLSDKGNAFGCFLGALAGEDCELQPPGKKWQDAGCVYGPKRTIAWRVLDAQYFGLAQRRRRVFVVASARDGFDPTEVLFEREGLRRDTAPRRVPGQDVAATLDARTDAGGFPGTDGACGGHVVSPPDWPKTFGGGANCQQTAVATALSAHPGGTRMDAETETFVVTAPLTTNQYGDHESRESLLVVHGTQDPGVSNKLAFALGRNNGQENAVFAFSCKDHGADAGEIAPTLRAMNHSGSHANAGGQVAVCITGGINHTAKAEGFDGSEDDTGRGQPIVTAYTTKLHHTSACGAGKLYEEYTASLDACSPPPALLLPSQVRRLTPRECERLQGFPDDYTCIPWRGRVLGLCPDGPRYKAIGNSKAVTVVRWIGRRLLKQL
ncbi:DNA cytosine methyltransferase [Pseudomonas sp. WS 5410]|uniref:DNA cytosine methyltransferase n=1 Tax=Pseudomonas sp. WS 5410 TaxID=2717485 RepID=UPI001474049B|nr:DNA cytosine methyltransferase [Pseudomonas sp. WS 5410]NMY23498.1 DNA cytosine methyltransferase [Pseudomonas sp. WS 5410]